MPFGRISAPRAAVPIIIQSQSLRRIIASNKHNPVPFFSRRLPARRLPLFLLGALASFAQHDAESLHIQNLEIFAGKRVMVQAHTRLRTRNDFQEFFQSRFGPILNVQVNRRVTAIGGYYFIHQRYPGGVERNWEEFNRYFGGASVRVLDRPSWSVDWRGLGERFHTIPGGDFTRLRSRATLTRSWRNWQSLGTFEVLHARNTTTVRSSASLIRRINRNLLLGFGYEFRQYNNGSVAHIVVTNTTFQIGRKE